MTKNNDNDNEKLVSEEEFIASTLQLVVDEKRYAGYVNGVVAIALALVYYSAYMWFRNEYAMTFIDSARFLLPVTLIIYMMTAVATRMLSKVAAIMSIAAMFSASYEDRSAKALNEFFTGVAMVALAGENEEEQDGEQK